MINRIFLLMCAFFGLLIQPSTFALELPEVFSDHMVLQRDMPVPVWGKAEPGYQVEVYFSKFGSTPTRTVADDVGDWSVRLPAMEASVEPGVLFIRSFEDEGFRTDEDVTPEAVQESVEGIQQAVFKDVLVGEVWHCSGQSNMAWGVKHSLNAEDEIAGADYPHMRLLTVPRRAAETPQFSSGGEWSILDLGAPRDAWTVCSPETVRHFSAVAYYFGRDLQQELDVPIGLMVTSWSGTPAESYTSPVSLEANPRFRPRYEQYAKALVALKTKRAGFPGWEDLPTTHEDPGIPGRDAADVPFADPGFDDRGWASLNLPTRYGDTVFKRGDGVVWLRRTVKIPEAWVGRELTLHLGQLHHTDVTYANGHEVGRAEGPRAFRQSRAYQVPADRVTDTSLDLAIRIFDSGGYGGVFASAESLFVEAEGDPEGRVELAGPWQAYVQHPLSPDDIRSGYELEARPNRRPGELFNAMIHPVAPYAHRGVIWYQGEANRGRDADYDALMKTLIEDWRALWDQPGEAKAFPFLTVQLANFTAHSDQPQDRSRWALVRDAQHTTAMTHPKTYMATAIDIGEADDIHPRNKQEVGRRLALIAKRRVYGNTSIVDQGPTCIQAEPVSGAPRTMRLYFYHAAGLTTSNGKPLRGFAVRAAEGGDWQWAASARIDGGQVLVVAPEGIEAPFAVRYGWADNPTDGPQGINLVNAAGLPAFPFEAVP